MTELPEIDRFLHAQPAFAELPDEARRKAASAIRIAYAREGSEILTPGVLNRELHLIRSGAVELRDQADSLVARLEEGDCFGYPSLMNETPVRNRARALEDTLLYQLDGAVFGEMRRQHPAFEAFFVRALTNRLSSGTAPSAIRGPVRQLLDQEAVTIDQAASIQDAARIMTERRVSAVLVTANGALIGIVTDRDLRRRVVATSRNIADPVRTVMTSEPRTLDVDRDASEAAFTMMQHNIHHLPVLDGERIVGLVSRDDLMQLETEHPLYLVAEIRRQTSTEAIAAVAARLPRLIASQVVGGTPPRELGRSVASVTDAVTRALLTQAETRLGPPPVPYAWLALGSQARFEQSAHSDQDNALLLDDDLSESDHEYFASMARYVNDGLNACGYDYCPGDVMASNPRWRQPLTAWQDCFRKWIAEPEAKALMHASIFFDLRCVHGDETLVQSLQSGIVELARRNTIFLALMTRNAMTFQTPLGFFRRFVVERSGDHKDTFDIKAHGVMPIVDIARIRALAAGLTCISSRDRLRGAAQAGEINQADAEDLIDALDIIETLRFEHQQAQLERGTAADNFLAPSSLSPLTRQILRTAFARVRTSQQALTNRFTTP